MLLMLRLHILSEVLVAKEELTWSDVWCTWKRGKNPCEIAWKTMLKTAEIKACKHTPVSHVNA